MGNIYQFSLISLSRVIFILGQLLYVKIYSNNITLHDIGLYFYIATISYILNAGIYVPLDLYQQSIIYKLKERKQSLVCILNFNKEIFKFPTIFILLLVGLYLINKNQLILDYLKYILIILVLAFNTYLIQLFRGILNNLDYKNDVSKSNVIEIIIKVLIIWIFVSYEYKSKDTILYSWLISQITTIYILSIYLTKNKVFTSETLEVTKLDNKDVLRQSYPISFGALINLVQLQGYRLIIVPLGSTEIVGIYSTLESIGKAGMNAVAAIYSQTFIPRIYKTDGKFTNTYIKNALLLASFVLIIFYIIDEYIVIVMTNSEFVKYKSLIFYGVIIEAANLIIGAYTIKLTLIRKNKISIWTSISAIFSLTIVFLCLILSDSFNVYSIGIPLVLSQLVVVLILWKYLKDKNC